MKSQEYAPKGKAAVMAGVDPSTISAWIRRKKLAPLVKNHCVVVSLADCRRLKREGRASKMMRDLSGRSE